MIREDRYGVTSTRSNVYHAQDTGQRSWSAICHQSGGVRFIVVGGLTEKQIRDAWPDRTLCRQCAKVLGGDS